MAKTTAPKSAAKSRRSRSPELVDGKSASRSRAGQGGNGAGSTVLPSNFPMPTGAFTVEQPPDPGPKRERFTFAKIPHVLEVPNLIELQKAELRVV